MKCSSHATPGACAARAAAFVAGDPRDILPACASKVLSAFLQAWHHSLHTSKRQDLTPYIPRLVGSVGPPALEMRRSWLARDWYVRVFTPAWLELAGLSEHAATLRALGELTTDAQLEDAQPALDAAANAATAVAVDVTDRAEAVLARMLDRAGGAAANAAWRSARTAARDAAYRAALHAAQSRVGKTGKALKPTVQQLQKSALVLLERMLAATA